MIANVKQTDLLCQLLLTCISWAATETMSFNSCCFPDRQIKDIQMSLTFVFFTVMPAFIGFLCLFTLRSLVAWYDKGTNYSLY